VKRSGFIRRYTPMPPSTVPLQRSRINKVSAKKRKTDRENKTYLDDYREANPLCQCSPDCEEEGEHIHEIAAGSHRERCRASVKFILHLNGRHHERCQGEPYAVGLSRKLACDPINFDLAGFLETIGRAPTAITITEVLAHMPKHLPTADECRHDIEDLERKVELLRRQLSQKHDALIRLHRELEKAEARELAIKRSQ
jgi:hypothetical protein